MHLDLIAPFAFLALAASARAQAPTVTVRDGRLLGAATTQSIGFGIDVALAGDTAVVGSPYNSSSTPGEARVFVRGVSGWSLQATLTPSNPADTWFGSSVAIEGERIVVGARGALGSGPGVVGALYVFERSGTQWTESARITGTGTTVDEVLGFSVALQGDTIACGAPRDPHYGAGAAYVFVHGLNGWTQQARFEPNDGEGFDYFGFDLALDGNRIAVGAHSDNHPTAANGGSVYIFERSGSTWSQVNKIVPADNRSNDLFGSALDLEGDTLVVGAPADDHGAVMDSGSLYVFTHGLLGWTQAQKVASISGQDSDAFGASVDLEGARLLVGEYYGANYAASSAGAAYLLERSGATFGVTFELTATSAEQWAGFGSGVALDGERALVAAYEDDSLATGNNTGAVYAYRLEPMVASYCTAKVNSQGCAPAITWSGLPLLATATPFEIVATNVLNQQNGLLFYGYASASVPFQGGTLCVALPLLRTALRNSGGSLGAPNCSGSYALDFKAHMASGVDPELFAGAEVFAQWWCRDPSAASTTGLTDALHFHVRP